MAHRKRKKRKEIANLVGPQIQNLRCQLGLTQERMAGRCQVHGFNISRGTLSQIEAQLRRVTDMELLRLASIFKVSTDALFPAKIRPRRTK